MTERRAPSVQYVRKRGDLKRLRFQDGIALVEVPIALLKYVRFKNERRERSDRLRRVERSIRDRGFVPFDPIVARIGQKGRWVIVDGGHRVTAAQRVAREFWTNLFGQKVRSLYFLLYETPRSWAKMRRPAKAEDPLEHPPEELAEPNEEA